MTSSERSLISRDATTAPVRGIEAVKDPCICGCVGINIPWFKKVRATPEFKRRLDQDVNTMLVKAKQIRTSGQLPYLPLHDLRLTTDELWISLPLVAKLSRLPSLQLRSNLRDYGH